MKISIIIVSWNVRPLLEKCLASIYQSICGPELEVFVVDNNSSDGSVKMIKEKFPAVNLIINDKNVGFACANNQGIKRAVGDYVLLLNPDTELDINTLAGSVDFMEKHPEAGVMGSKMVYGDGSLQPSVRRFPSLGAILLMLFKVPKILPNLRAVNYYLATDFNYSKAQVADQVMGAYMFIRLSALKRVGELDERFFIWFEEVDFCRRIWQAGFKVYYNPAVKIVHYGGKSFAQQKVVTNQRRFFASAFKYFLKYKFQTKKSHIAT